MLVAMLAKRTAKNQITLPKRVADQFSGTDYFEVTAEEGKIVLRPVELDPLARIQKKLTEIGIEEDDIRKAVAWARRSKR